MAIEIYSLVTFVGPVREEDKAYLRELRTAEVQALRLGEKEEARFFRKDQKVIEHTSRDVEYHFCHCRLVQSSGGGRTVPVPKWEIVDDKGVVDVPEGENCYNEMTADQFRKRSPDDPYRDCFVEYRNGTCSWWVSPKELIEAKRVYVPDYLKEWRQFLSDRDIDEEGLEPAPYLPLHHPIEDRKVQLRQIRFLFPECRVMPMYAALDYVREKI